MIFFFVICLYLLLQMIKIREKLLVVITKKGNYCVNMSYCIIYCKKYKMPLFFHSFSLFFSFILFLINYLDFSFSIFFTSLNLLILLIQVIMFYS